jgi:hypothetical protein
MEILGERPVWSMSDSEKLSALDAAVAEEARIKTLRLQLTAAIHDSRYATELGAADTARLLSQRYRIDPAEARRDVRLATRLTKYAATTAALPDPTIPFANPTTARATPTDLSAADVDAAESPVHAAPAAWRVHPAQAEAIVSILEQVPATVPAENIEFAEQQLIDLAATHTPSELRKAGQTIRDILDPDGPEPDEKAAYTRESLTLKTADRGITFRGYLANENAELFRTLIHAHAKPHKTIDGELDPRPRDKRQADALTTILTTATNTAINTAGTSSRTSPPADHGDALPFPSDQPADREPAVPEQGGSVGPVAETDFVAGHGPKAHISVTIDFNALAAATANATGNLVFGDNLSAATVRRLACDAEILPIVLGSKSQPLDVGTGQRLVTRPMRRALNARDRGCVVCGAPPIQCEAHHVVPWLSGGITAVSNLALLCKRHHLDLHSGHWQIRILDGVVHVTRPTWADPAAIPPGRYRPPTADIVHRPATPPPDPWSDGEHATQGTGAAPPTPAHPRKRVPFDPWGDGEDHTPPRGVSPTPVPADSVERVPFNPWGDSEEQAPATGDAPQPAHSIKPLPFDPWNDEDSDEAPPYTTAGSVGRVLFDPWDDNATNVG